MGVNKGRAYSERERLLTSLLDAVREGRREGVEGRGPLGEGVVLLVRFFFAFAFGSFPLSPSVSLRFHVTSYWGRSPPIIPPGASRGGCGFPKRASGGPRNLLRRFSCIWNLQKPSVFSWFVRCLFGFILASISSPTWLDNFIF